MGLGEKKALVNKYVSQGLSTTQALRIVRVTRHQYYYKQTNGKPGRMPSNTTLKYIGNQVVEVVNDQVVEDIKKLKSDPDLNGGYKSATFHLNGEGYIINKKKTRRLMSNHCLLSSSIPKHKKNYAMYRKVVPNGPFEVLEMDIKMVWIERDRRHALILNVLDTFTRRWLYRDEAFSITKHKVKQAWEDIILNHLQPNDCLQKGVHIEIRNDNDPRFSAQIIQDFFKENYLNQVFTHPYTPEENGHIESFHGILSKHLSRYVYWTIEELTADLDVFMDKYNNVRQHTQIAHLSPNDFDQLWNNQLIEVQTSTNKKRKTFKLKIPRHQVKNITGNNEPEGSSLHRFEPLDGATNRNKGASDLTPAPSQLTV
jgi:putative transposase